MISFCFLINNSIHQPCCSQYSITVPSTSRAGETPLQKILWEGHCTLYMDMKRSIIKCLNECTLSGESSTNVTSHTNAPKEKVRHDWREEGGGAPLLAVLKAVPSLSVCALTAWQETETASWTIKPKMSMLSGSLSSSG